MKNIWEENFEKEILIKIEKKNSNAKAVVKKFQKVYKKQSLSEETVNDHFELTQSK